MTKQLFRFLRWGTVLAIAGGISISAPALAELTISPEAVVIAGDRSSKISTTLTLSDDKGNTALKPAVSDLRRADGAAFIPANKIVISPSEITVPKDAPSQATIAIDLGQASANGEFAGSLYLYRGDGRQVIPLTVRVKEAPVLPWIVMIIGVGLGSLLSIYRVDGRSRDEIVVQVSRLQNEMNSDADLHKDFRASIESKLVRVSSALADKDWEAAKAEVSGAKGLWNRWQEFRDDWIAQLRYSDRLIEENKDLKEESPTIFVQGIKNNFDTVYRKLRAGQIETPQALSEVFSEIRDQLSFYKEGLAAVDRLKDRRRELPKNKENEWLKKLDTLEVELRNSKPNKESLDKWQASFNEKQQALEKEIEESSEHQASLEPDLIVLGRSGVNLPEDQQVPLVPSIGKDTKQKEGNQDAKQLSVNQAKNNLWWFNQTSRCIAIVFLAWLGMIELYSSKPTFGAEPMRDYFALLAWGFGAELTRESITRTSQNLGVPLGDKEK